MSKVKIIDRLELTRQSSKLLQRHKDIPREKAEDNLKQQQDTSEEHGDICPKCGQRTLHHVEGCETCASCGYSACSYVW